jgi:hypothetical protein
MERAHGLGLSVLALVSLCFSFNLYEAIDKGPASFRENM